jgi:hypothetical protein
MAVCFLLLLLVLTVKDLIADLEVAEEAANEERLLVSSLCNWAVIRLGDRHPEIEPVCMAIETAVQTGRPLDTEKLGRALEELKKAGAS